MKKLKVILISIITTIVGILSFIFISKSKKTKRELEMKLKEITKKFLKLKRK